MTIGKRLKDERKRLGYNQTDFSALGGVQISAQVNYENDRRYPDTAYLAAIAVAGADVLYILTGEISGTALTPDERQLLELFRAAPLTGKMAAVGALQGVIAGGQTIIATGNAKAAGRDLHCVPKRTRQKTKVADK